MDEEIVVSDDIPDASLAIEELECEPKEESPLDKIKDLVNDKMVAVAVAAAKTIGVVADGLGEEFKPFGKVSF